MIVMNSSPLLSSVSMFSFSKVTPTPFSLSLRTVVRVSTVLRAKRLTDLVMIRSIMPAMASSIMRLKFFLRLVLVPVMPSSAYTSTKIPFRILTDFLGVVVHLSLIGGLLLLVIGADAGIGRDPAVAPSGAARPHSAAP